jgi:endoglucanase
MLQFIPVLIACLSLASIAQAQSMPRLRVDGPRIIDEAGKPVTLRGVNLGNWLLIEPGVFNSAIGKFDDQDTLFQILRDRFGEGERRRLINVYRDHFITARDFDNVAAFKFNLVRVGFDYDLLEDDVAPMKLRDDAFKYLDFAVAQAKRRGIYVLFDLHGAQGRTENGKQSGRNGPAEFWDKPEYQERSLWLWRQVAEHFKGDPTVMGYEALNEPWGKTPAALRDYCERWYKAIREVDADAITIFPGWTGDLKFYGNPKENGWTNAMFDMHFYPGLFRKEPPTMKTNIDFLTRGLAGWQRYMESIQSPLLVGEINVVHKPAGGGEMMRRYYDFFAERGWAVTFWTLKEHRPDGGIKDTMWMLTTNRDDLKTVDIATSTKAEIEAFFESLSTIPLVTDDDLLHWLTTSDQPGPLPTTAPTTR